jgi:hypothetical protein
MGANAYFRKPSGYEACIRIGEIVKDLLLIEQPPEPGRLMPSWHERPIRRCYPAYCLAACADTGLIQELLSLLDNKSLDCIGIRIHHDIALR